MKSIIMIIASLAIGFAMGYFVNGGFKREALTTTEQKWQELSIDSLKTIHEISTDLLEEKASARFDSLKKVGAVRDSCILAVGKIESSMIDQVKKPELYKQLESLRSNLLSMIANCDRIIMDGALELLQSNNESLRTLVKDINEKIKKLQQTAQNIATVSDIVGFVVKVLALPILQPVAAVAQTTQ
jgi:hypothetical protein